MDRKVDLKVDTRFGLLSFEDLLSELKSPTKRAPRHRQVTKPTTPGGSLRFRKRLSKPCPCGDHRWTIVREHVAYRDPFLRCQGCRRNYRMDRTPLDIQYAWRDGIPMPDEVTHTDAHHPSDDPV